MIITKYNCQLLLVSSLCHGDSRCDTNEGSCYIHHKFSRQSGSRSGSDWATMNPPNQHFKDAFKSFGWWAGLNGTEKKTSLSLLVFSLAHGRSFTMVLSGIPGRFHWGVDRWCIPPVPTASPGVSRRSRSSPRAPGCWVKLGDLAINHWNI